MRSASDEINAPSIHNEREYIKWFLANCEELSNLRAVFTANREMFLELSTDAAIEMLEEYPTSDSLYNRISQQAVAYENDLKPFIEKQGGLQFCSREMQGVAASLLTNIYVGIEFLDKKYEHTDIKIVKSVVRDL